MRYIRRHIALVWQKLSNSGVAITALSLVPYGMWIDVSKLWLHALQLHRRNLSEGLWGGKPRLPCWMMMNNGSVAPGALANSHQLPEARPPNQPLTVDSWMSPAEPSSKTQTAGPKKAVNSINSCLMPPHCGVLCYVAKANWHPLLSGKEKTQKPHIFTEGRKSCSFFWLCSVSLRDLSFCLCLGFKGSF